MARSRPRLITRPFALVMLATLAYFTSIGIVLPNLPRYVEGPLGGTNFDVGIAVGAFAISAVLLRPFVGGVSDRRGRRILIIGGGVIVGLSVLGYMIATSMLLLTIARILTGVGEAAYYVGAASVINDISPDERRGEALSYFSLALFGGLAVGPVVGEWIVQRSGFDAGWIAAGAASLLSGMVGLLVQETRPENGNAAEGSPVVSRGALLPGAILATNVWALATFNAFIPLYSQDLGMDQVRYLFVLNSAILMSVRLFGARLPDALGPRRAASTALVFTAVGFITMSAWAAPAALFVGTAIYALGHALAFPALMTLAIDRAPVAERGAAIGTFTAFFDLAFGVGAAAAGGVAGAFGYRGAFFAATLVALAGLTLLLLKVPGRDHVVARRSAEATA